MLEYLFLVFIFQFIKYTLLFLCHFLQSTVCQKLTNVSNNYLLTGSFAPSYSGSEEYLKLMPFCGLRKMTLGRLAIPIAYYYKS